MTSASYEPPDKLNPFVMTGQWPPEIYSWLVGFGATLRFCVESTGQKKMGLLGVWFANSMHFFTKQHWKSNAKKSPKLMESFFWIISFEMCIYIHSGVNNNYATRSGRLVTSETVVLDTINNRMVLRVYLCIKRTLLGQCDPKLFGPIICTSTVHTETFIEHSMNSLLGCSRLSFALFICTCNTC